MRFCSLKTFRSSLRQGIIFHSFIGLIAVTMTFLPLLEPIPSKSSCLRLPILSVTPGICFLDNPSPLWLAVSTCSELRPISESHKRSYFVPNIHWFEPLEQCFPPGLFGNASWSCNNRQSLILRLLATACQPIKLFCNNDGSSHFRLCYSWVPARRDSGLGSQLPPFYPALRIDG